MIPCQPQTNVTNQTVPEIPTPSGNVTPPEEESQLREALKRKMPQQEVVKLQVEVLPLSQVVELFSQGMSSWLARM